MNHSIFTKVLHQCCSKVRQCSKIYKSVQKFLEYQHELITILYFKELFNDTKYIAVITSYWHSEILIVGESLLILTFVDAISSLYCVIIDKIAGIM